MSAKIIVLVGMVGSGKSTYALEAAKKGAIVVNADGLETAIHGGYYQLYSKDLKLLYKSVENHIAHAALALGRDAVIDRTNLKSDARRRWTSLAKSLEVRCVAVVFPMATPEIHAKRRAGSDGRGYSYEKWLEVAERHWKEFTAPTVEEGFDEIVYANVKIG